MAKSNEALVGEAVASLRSRLTTWGVEDPAQRASEYVHDMLRAGWRPSARPVEAVAPGVRAGPEAVAMATSRAREAIRAARTIEALGGAQGQDGGTA